MPKIKINNINFTVEESLKNKTVIDSVIPGSTKMLNFCVDINFSEKSIIIRPRIWVGPRQAAARIARSDG